ncbi:MAG: 2,3-bisphosphoglycerate-independent phosphoglycerate mutase [Nitrososphaerales archaeon]
MTNTARKSKSSVNSVVLVILDGWGIAPKSNNNAIKLARTPNFERIKKAHSGIEICASGKCVGLTEGQMGNSEVGHLTIGAGRIIFQDLMRVNEEVESGRLGRNGNLVSALKNAKKRGLEVHFLGLLSDGGVHSHMLHLFALLKIAKSIGVPKVLVHAFLDGRDTPPRSGIDYIASLQSELDSIGVGEIVTVAGRYYAMDRDARWDRIKLAYDAIMYAKGPSFEEPVSSLKQSYDEGISDEFVIPRVMRGYKGVHNGDVLIFYNFRPDRARQLSRALTSGAKEFGSLFDRSEPVRPKKISLVTMTNYDPKLRNVKTLLGREHVSGTLSNILERNSVNQIKIAETEKYAHVTYFFNGLVEKPMRFEDRILVPSLKVGTYDKSPEMSARAICESAVKAIKVGSYGFILINFANSDMVGHSGNVAATISAVETVDSCLGEIYRAWEDTGGRSTLIVTSDHGNAEKMFDAATKQQHTAHTSNPVPFIVVSNNWKTSSERPGGLSDVAPTILHIMGLSKPKSMTGRSLVVPFAD